MNTEYPRIEIKRVFRAPKEQVFAAWMTPELMTRWMAPGIAEVLKCEIDFKVGGKYRLHLRGEMLGHAYDVVIGGVYREIIPNECLSFTWVYEDEGRRDTVGNSVVTVIVQSIEAGTELTLVHEKIASQERREGHRWGWNSCLEKLHAVLEEGGLKPDTDEEAR